MLIDTEVEISIIKISTLLDKFSFNKNDTILMKGITNERQRSLGSLNLILIFEHLSIEHKFHIVTDNFPIPTHGILGKDFAKRHKCLIDYSDMSFTIRPTGLTPAKIQIKSELLKGLTVVPPRSETFKLFRIQSTSFPCIVPKQEISKDVLIPTTIAYGTECWIRVLNMSNRNEYIQNTKVKIDHLDAYNIFSINNSQNSYPNVKRAEELSNILGDKIPKHIEQKLLPLCMEFSDIFHIAGDKPTVNNFYSQSLNVQNNQPVYVKNYRLPHTQKHEIKNQVQQLLSDELIEMSKSNYNSPLIVVPKKSTDGTKKWRMCVDYRLLNRKLIPDKFPLPRIDEILDGLGRAKYFSVIDLQSGYHQIPIDEKSRYLTAFSTENGLFQWKVLPFGINIAPASFTQMMTLAFSGLTPEQDDIWMILSSSVIRKTTT